MERKKEIVKVNTITITSDLLKNNYLLMKFSISYRKLFKSVLERLDSDSSSSDTMLSLDELLRMKQVLKDKYMQVVSKEEYKKMLVKMELLEHKLKERIMIEKSVQKYIERQLMEEEVKEKGRGR